jgi:N-formylglutamate amidohydrolase
MRAIAAILRIRLSLSCTQYGEGEVDEVLYSSDQLFKDVKKEKMVQALDRRLDHLEAIAHRPRPIRLEHPRSQAMGVIVSCPHSGRFYPPELLKASVLDQFALRRSEDAFVDLLFQDTPSHGALLVVNEFARAFVDVNRSPGELDPKLIYDVLPSEAEASSDRVKAGLGVIPRTVGDGVSIYVRRMARQDAVVRLQEVHEPWHQMLEDCLMSAVTSNGVALLLDCHSMPCGASGEPSFDVVLGDRFGASCAPLIMTEAIRFLRSAGLSVGRNDPYAGGYTTRRHGQVHRQHHALQIEINRSLYMVEGAMNLRPSFGFVRQTMSDLVAHLVRISVGLGVRAN